MLLDFIDAIHLVKTAILAVRRNQVTQFARKNWLALKTAHISRYETYQRQKIGCTLSHSIFVLIQMPIFLFLEGYF